MEWEKIINTSILLLIIGYFAFRAWNATSKNGFQFFIYTLPSWIVVGIIFGLLYFMEQGKSLVIDLYYGSPGVIFYNLLVFNALLFFLSLIISHYPIYLKQFLFENHSNYEWRINDNKFSFLGVITYKFKGGLPENAYHKIRIIGLFPFIAWIFVLLDTMVYYQSYASVSGGRTEDFSPFVKLFLVTIFLLAIVLYRQQVKVGYSPRKNRGPLVEMTLLGNLVLFVVLVLYASQHHWCITTVLIQLILSINMLAFFVLFRANRINLKAMIFEKLNFLKKFSTYYHYLARLRNAGILIMALIFAINVSTSAAEATNSINILMLVLVTVYTIVVLWIKHWTYYIQDYELNPDRDTNIYYFIYPVKANAKRIAQVLSGSSAGLIAMIIISAAIGNNLHLLTSVPVAGTQQNLVSQQQFLSDYKSQSYFVKDSTVYYYACFGGGLKAHTWNLLIMEHMRKKEIDFFKKIISFSGVSGGAMALANYGWISRFDEEKRQKMIEKIALANITSLELSWLFGYDLLREWTPLNVQGYDRSHRVMKWYENTIEGNGLLVNKLTFSEVWSKIYKHHGFYPNLILNSTSTTQKYGVVSPLRNGNTFPGSVNLLSIDNNTKSLGYLEGASTCNRFPVVSPAARVEGIGHFVDGGYFENSGILSTLSFKKYFVQNDPELKKAKNILFTVANDKNKYIQKILSDVLIKNSVKVQEKPTAELSAILHAVSDTDKLPNYLAQKISIDKEFDNVFTFYLPYPVSKQDLIDFFGGHYTESEKIIDSIVNKSNQIIIDILKDYEGYQLSEWGVTYPALSRNIGLPAYLYMKAMLEKHPDFYMIR